MKRLGILGWIAATVVSVWISTQAVAAVRQEVVGPYVPVTTVAALGASSSNSNPLQTSTSIAPQPTVLPSTTTVSATSVTSTSVASASTTAAPTTTATPSTTVVTTSTSSAPPATTTSPPRVQTYQLEGGWVRIAVGNGTVTLDAAAPAVGFTMEIEEEGPDKVELRFRGEEHESRFEAEWEDGELKVDVDEED